MLNGFRKLDKVLLTFILILGVMVCIFIHEFIELRNAYKVLKTVAESQRNIVVEYKQPVEEPEEVQEEPTVEEEEPVENSDAVEDTTDNETDISEYVEPEPEPATNNSATYQESGVLTKSGGVNYYNGRRETWYSQKVLPGGGLDIPGRHVTDDGLVRDENGYICVAASDVPKGSVIETSLGTAKVYDTGCADGTTDIYTNW